MRSVVQDSARCWSRRDGARRRVERGEKWRTAPGRESMVKGSARRRAVRDGARRPVARGLTARKAPSCERLDINAGLRKRDRTRRQAV
eukprot:6214318-Pleurochrysis_carterae.AAC.2